MTKHNAVTMEQLQWLLERINATIDPITREQVRAFGRHPDGPILPDTCTHVLRLPEAFGTLTSGSRAKNRVDSLAMSPSGGCWLTTIIKGRSHLVQMEYATDAGPVLPPQYQYTFLIADEPGASFRSRIIGFWSNGLPVIECVVVGVSSTSKYYGTGAKFFVGGVEQKFADNLPPKYAALCVTPDWALLTLHEHEFTDEHGRCSVWRNGECILRTDDDMEDIFVLNDGAILTTARHHGGCYLYQWTGSDALHDPPRHIANAKYHNHGFGGRIVQARGRIGDLRLTIDADARNVVITCYTDPNDPENGTVIHRLGDRPYIGHDAVLPDGRTVYVGKAFRDDLQRMVVDGVPQEPFEQVTGVAPLGGPHYFGVVGRHLCMMDLPPRAAAA